MRAYPYQRCRHYQNVYQNLYRNVGLVFVLLLVLSSLHCAKAKNTSPQSAKEVAAPDQISESFITTTDPKTGQPTLWIRKKALDKEFLLQASLIEQVVAAMGRSLKSRIVAFKKKAGLVYLMEATAGHTVTTELPQNLILAAYPILNETEADIQLDFNAGMSAIFATGDWKEEDLTGAEYKPSFNIEKIRLSFLEDIKAVANRMEIRQIAQVPTFSLAGESAETYEVRYTISPYQPNPAFETAPPADFRRVGFFEVAPQLQLDGSNLIRPTKFNAKDPIVFAVSANTPADYRQAVRDGILYWKGVLPGIQAVDGPTGVTAPDPVYNVIQWVSHETAGMAYADAQMDPRTGEVLHAQAFITSTFAFSGRKRVRSLLRQLQVAPAGPKRHMLSGFELEPMCEMKAASELQRSLETLLSVQAADSTILRVSQDYIRAVVAHEVGHLLGLRHNFAGSLSTKNYPFDRRAQIFDKYLSEDVVPVDLEVSSSEMDYLGLEESALHGLQMRLQPGKLYPYDATAVQMLYFGKDPKESEVPLFCTDSQVNSYVDCREHDAGASAMEFAVASANRGVDTIPNRLVEAFIAAKAPPVWEISQPVERVNLDPKAIAKSIAGPGEELVSGLAGSKHLLAVIRTFPFVGPLNEEEVRAKELEFVESEIKRLGGWDKIFPLLAGKDYERIFDETQRLLNDDHYTSGEGPGGQAYAFTPNEIEAVLGIVLNLAVKLPDTVATLDINSLKGIPDKWKRAGTTLGTDIAQVLLRHARNYLLTTRSSGKIVLEFEVIKAQPQEGTTVPPVLVDSIAVSKKLKMELPAFAYSQEVREKTHSLLSAPLGLDGYDWGTLERTALKAEFKSQLDASCACDISTFPLDKLQIRDPAMKHKVLLWFLENKKILYYMP